MHVACRSLHYYSKFTTQCYKQFEEIINIMIEKGVKIHCFGFEMLHDTNVLHAIIYSSKVDYYEKELVSIDNALKLIQFKNVSVKEIINDYQQNKFQIWKPERHHLFPTKIKNSILYFMILVKKFSIEILRKKIPRPLLWIIINQLVWKYK